MDIESEQFYRRRIVPERLELYGFTRKDGGYEYSEGFLGGDFRADVFVSDEGAVSGRVIDTGIGEEYTAIYSDSRYGPFVNTVREAYCGVLRAIAEKCTVRVGFIFDQTNRIAERIFEKYGESPDYPFAKSPGCGVFRYPKNRKWYGLVMDITMGKLERRETKDDRVIEVLNVKIRPERREELFKRDGIYPCYHMNRENWITVLLDGPVSDDFIMELIGESRDFAVAAGGGSGIPREGRKTWIVPANPSYYDVDAAFAENDVIIWKQSSSILVGDIVYLYVGSPVSSVRYECEAVETDIPFEHSDKNVSIRRVMRIKKLREFDRSLLPFGKINELGITAVRGPRGVTKEFSDFVKSL